MNRQSYFRNRRYLFFFLFAFIGFVFLIKLFLIQIIDKKYLISSQNNSLRKVTIYPSRGLIYDRNNKIIVQNDAVYDLMVIPGQIKELDTLELCSFLQITKENLENKIIKARKYSSHIPSLFEAQISKEVYAFLQEKLFKYHGFYVQNRTLRKYSYAAAAHTLGYVSEVNKRVLKDDIYYKTGDYIGVSGLEKTFEVELRGKKGEELMLVDVLNRKQGSFENGKYDTKSEKGTDLYCTLDIELQLYGEKLMQNKKGSIVAIEPATGEILCLISSPSYDPNLLIGRQRSSNFNKLRKDSLVPLFNRALMALYPPGSPFKIINALIGLEENSINQNTFFSCRGTINKPIRCSHNHISPLSLNEAIEQSCNSYFWNCFQSIFKLQKYKNTNEAYNVWRSYVNDFHIGRRFESDLFNMSKGFLPKEDYYNKYYRKGHWNALTIRSMSIGQGELLVTPLHLANLSAIVANRGWYYTPHLIKSIGKNDKMEIEKHNTSINIKNFLPIIEGMHHVFVGDHGTAKWYNIDEIEMCGKTGTVQNPHGDDHSLFIAFAPKEKPEIAIAVIVENSGFGSRWAVPISTLMIEKYINDTISKRWIEERMLKGNLIEN